MATTKKDFVAHFFRNPEAGEIGVQGFFMVVEAESKHKANTRAEQEATANDWRLLSVEVRNEKHEPYLKS